MLGDYLLYLYDRFIRSQYEVYVVETGDEHSRFCIPPALADMLRLKEENSRLLAPVGQCLNLNTVDSEAIYSPDNQSLYITLL